MDPRPLSQTIVTHVVKQRNAVQLLAWAAAFGLVLTLASDFFNGRMNQAALQKKMEQITAVRLGSTPVSCADLARAHPLVLLALGQSNAGNHGLHDHPSLELVNVLAGEKCWLISDPLPGGTGVGDSIWQRLPKLLAQAGFKRPVVLSVLAVDASSIGDWTMADSPLRKRLEGQLITMNQLGLRADLVLWQQGEADARLKTSAKSYEKGLDSLASSLDNMGLHSPIILAMSTVCQSSADAEIRLAIERKITTGARWQRGPDTDMLTGTEFRSEACHFTGFGLDRAAKMWTKAIQSTGVLKGPRE